MKITKIEKSNTTCAGDLFLFKKFLPPKNN